MQPGLWLTGRPATLRSICRGIDSVYVTVAVDVVEELGMDPGGNGCAKQ